MSFFENLPFKEIACVAGGFVAGTIVGTVVKGMSTSSKMEAMEKRLASLESSKPTVVVTAETKKEEAPKATETKTEEKK